MIFFAISIFLGSFLLFQVQPLIGRFILPWFGGTPAVWTTCMLFFQAALLAGYAYADVLSRLGRKKQTVIHLGLLALSLLFINIAPAPAWKPASTDEPVSRILLLLASSIGVPYILLASTAPLTQYWFSLYYPDRSPYRLYAVSNASSLLGLLTYPFLIEPRFTLALQARAWGALFLVYLLSIAWCAVRSLHVSRDVPTTRPLPAGMEKEKTPEKTVFLLWVALAACGSALLVSVTNQLCQEVAVIPFLWVVPLVIYLATFTICFSSDRAYDRILWGILLAAALVPGCRVLSIGVHAGLAAQIVIYLAVLLAGCMVFHGELARLKPSPCFLTRYYLAIALGGAFGGAAIALAAPFAFSDFWEYPIVLGGSSLVVIGAWWHQGVIRQMPLWLKFPLSAGLVALLAFVTVWVVRKEDGEVFRTRNFYGVLRVQKFKETAGEKLTLMHGRIAHGSQFIAPEMTDVPTSYYGPESGAGLALRRHPRRTLGPLTAGVIGLGAGTLAAHSKPGDTFRFYEINPAVIDISERFFSYRREADGTVEVVPGDARMVLEEELKNNRGQNFDILMIDAFSSDAIPVHLITRECFDIYRRHTKPDGVILFHITNRFLDLIPVALGHARQAGMDAVLVSSPEDMDNGVWKADWVVISNNRPFMESIRGKATIPTASPLRWTDDFSSLWQVVK